MSARYPILSILPPDESAALEAQADCGIPLTPQQAARLGLGHLQDVRLLPVDGSLTPEQIRAAFPDREAVLRDVIRFSRKVEDGATTGEARAVSPAPA